MKRVIVSILALLYLSSATGATVQVHYCMGKLSAWEGDQQESKTCGNCGMDKSSEKDNGCCKDEHKFVKNDSKQKVAESAFHMMEAVAVAILPAYLELSHPAFSSITEENPLSNAPPRSSTVAVYILNSKFLI